MKNHQKIIITLLLAVPMAVILLGVKAEASPNATFSQQIRPLQCVVSTTEIGGITTVSYSPGCGESVMPPPSVSPPASAPITAAPITGAQPPSSSGGGSIELISDNPAIYSPWGLTLIVKEGLKYQLYLETDNKNNPPRTLTIVDITDKGIVVRLEPGGITRGLVVGDKAELDINGDGIVDMRLHLMAINGQKGVLRVVLYHQISKEQTVVEKWYQQAVLATLLVLSTLVVHLYHRRKIPHLHTNWHAPHNYRFK
jgi:hypothetical protein